MFCVHNSGNWGPDEIRAFRQKHDLTQRALGDIVGVANTTVYLWEAGKLNPGKPVMILLSHIQEELERKK